MPLEIPPELKKIAPYIKRAEELDKDHTAAESRLVAYYLRQYAVQLGIPLIAGASPAAKTCLGTILGDLEKEKSKMDNFTRDEAAFLCRKFAMNVFNKADNEDRAGLAGKGTAKTFYAAQSFLQMLDQFATTPSDEGDENEQRTEDKKRILYCKWKATEILKAIKEGREPTPGGYGDDVVDNMIQDTINEEDGTTNITTEKPVVQTITNDDDDDFGLPVAPTKLPPPPPPQLPLPPPVLPPPPPSTTSASSEPEDDEGTEVALGPPPAYSTTTDASTSTRPSLSFNLPPIDVPTPTKPKAPSIFGGFLKKNESKSVSKAQLTDAMELTRFALAALEDRDSDLAAERLQQALSALGRS